MKSKYAVAALGAFTIFAAACGGGGDDTASATPDVVIEGVETATGADTSSDGTAGTDTDAEAGSDEDKALAFAECMRGEGLDWADPTVGADGSIDLFGGQGGPPGAGGAGGAGGGLDEDTQSAFEACGPLLEGASFLPENGGIDAETQDSFLEFTQCLRDNGIDVDDPDFSDFGGGPPAGGDGEGGFLGGFDPEDPDNAAAIEACQGLFTGGPGGPLGGGN